MCQNDLARKRERLIGVLRSLSAEAAEELPSHLLTKDAEVSLHEVYFGGESLFGKLLFEQPLSV